MKKLIAGNWKMNLDSVGAARLVNEIISGLEDNLPLQRACDFAVFPPFVHLPPLNQLIKSTETKLILGSQDCSPHVSDGAYTGEISAPMLKDYGVSHVILGHSERRQYHNESNELVSSKVKAAHHCGLVAVICVGESAIERDSGREQEVVGRQLSACLPETVTCDNTIIAYEPVWAIGSGKSAEIGDVESMHAFIRSKLKEQLADSEKMRILYGGSMKPENAGDLLSVANVDGGLIGGASLNADQFLAIGRAVIDA